MRQTNFAAHPVLRAENGWRPQDQSDHVPVLPQCVETILMGHCGTHQLCGTVHALAGWHGLFWTFLIFFAKVYLAML